MCDGESRTEGSCAWDIGGQILGEGYVFWFVTPNPNAKTIPKYTFAALESSNILFLKTYILG